MVVVADVLGGLGLLLGATLGFLGVGVAGLVVAEVANVAFDAARAWSLLSTASEAVLEACVGWELTYQIACHMLNAPNKINGQPCLSIPHKRFPQSLYAASEPSWEPSELNLRICDNKRKLHTQ